MKKFGGNFYLLWFTQCANHGFLWDPSILREEMTGTLHLFTNLSLFIIYSVLWRKLFTLHLLQSHYRNILRWNNSVVLTFLRQRYCIRTIFPAYKAARPICAPVWKLLNVFLAFGNYCCKEPRSYSFMEVQFSSIMQLFEACWNFRTIYGG